MECYYELNVKNPPFENLGYIVAIADLSDKHDRSAPSHYHWKILKCRMIIFSHSSILACPDKSDLRQVHIIFNKIGDDYDKVNSLLIKFSLVQDGGIRKVTNDMYLLCFHYTMSAKIAPVWNTLGYSYYINNRDFLTATAPQEALKYHISSSPLCITLDLKPVKVHLMNPKENYLSGEEIRVLPSLNKAVIEEYHDTLPKSSDFRTYKDLRRHWKNIHGYRLPEEEYPYCSVRFWRGEPLTYPIICLTRLFPIVTPIPKAAENAVLERFMHCLKIKMCHVLGIPLIIEQSQGENITNATKEKIADTQTVSLCTPTQKLFK